MKADSESDRAVWIKAVLARYETPLVNYAARLVGDADRARDVVQDTLLRLCERRPADANGDLACWLFTVCRRRALDVRKKERRAARNAEPILDARLDTGPSPGERLQQRQETVALHAVLAELPERDQEIVRLKFQAGLSYKQIAEVMNLSVSNVGFLLHTVIAKIRQRLPREDRGASK